MSDQPVQPNAVIETSAAPTPDTETVNGEKFDAARAMSTIEKLRAEIKELKPKAKQAEEVILAEQKRKEAEMTELQKLQAELEKTKAEYKAIQLSEMRRAAAAKVELPAAFADRLRGETPEELEADAKQLLEALPKGAPKLPAVGATNPGAGASTQKTADQHRAEFYGTDIDPFSPEYAKTHGGGVVWNQKSLEPPS